MNTQAKAGAARSLDGRRDVWLVLGERLVAKRYLNEAKLARALSSVEKTGEPLPSVLIKLGLCSEDAVAATLAEVLGLSHAKLAGTPRIPADLASLRPRFLLDSNVVPLAVDGGEVILAMADPLDDEAANAVGYKTGLSVRRAVATRSDIRAWLSAIRPRSDAAGADEPTVSVSDNDLERLIDLARGAPVIRWVEDVLAMAV
ncbi:MAG: hypothetical protein Q8S09_01840, partial [Hyphomonas sp.]|nr:hypothetical protein [Hyphomonas sp.]